MAKIRVEVEEKRYIYVHNSLMNTVYYMKEKILEREKQKDREGIALEIMATLTMLAFAYEAKINFIGEKVVEKWREFDSFRNKSNRIYDALGLQPNLDERPYSSIEQLKKFRDDIAHGKPIEEIKTYEAVVEQSDRIDIDLGYGHEDFCTVENLVNIYSDIEQVWEEYLNAAEVEHHQTKTYGMGGMTYIEHV